MCLKALMYVIPQCQVSLKIRLAGVEPFLAVSHGQADARSFAAFDCEGGRKEEKFLYKLEMLLLAHLVKELPVIYVSQLPIIAVFTRSALSPTIAFVFQSRLCRRIDRRG
jgi:hypothetical protein